LFDEDSMIWVDSAASQFTDFDQSVFGLDLLPVGHFAFIDAQGEATGGVCASPSLVHH